MNAPRRPKLTRKRLRPQLPREAVPSFFTLMNLLSGFIAIINIAEGRLTLACWFIVLAAFFDVLDGMMARLTNSQSMFGVELDSLADVVSFGVAPAFLIYQFGLSDLRTFGIFVAALPALCGAVRLARFNVQFNGEKSQYFTGLPIPTAAAALVSLVLNVEATWFVKASLGSVTALVPIVIGLSALMVSTIPFDAGPRPSASYIKTYPVRGILYLIGLLLMLTLQQVGLFIALWGYLFIGIGLAFVRLYRDVREAPLEP